MSNFFSAFRWTFDADAADSGEADMADRRTLNTFDPSTSYLTKTERLEHQARIVTQAIREARERGIVDDDDSFLHPYPANTPAKGLTPNTIWLDLGQEPHAWGRAIPPVPDRWLETLSLGLTKSIVADQAMRDSLVEDYDLEDHERLEQLGDSIVNMSSRLLAYTNYPDVNEGTLTRLSNYPTQNNILGILFREAGLADRRRALRDELRPSPEEQADEAEVDDSRAESGITRGLVKKDADMFEAYVAAVFLSHGSNFEVVHRWLSELFHPFQAQAFRFMVARSEMVGASPKEKGILANSLDPILASLEHKKTNDDGTITDEFLTVAARSRRQREEQQRRQEEEMLMGMSWLQRGYLALRQGFDRLMGRPPEEATDSRDHVRRDRKQRR